jgi:hypothetical protein
MRQASAALVSEARGTGKDRHPACVNPNPNPNPNRPLDCVNQTVRALDADQASG